MADVDLDQRRVCLAPSHETERPLRVHPHRVDGSVAVTEAARPSSANRRSTSAAHLFIIASLGPSNSISTSHFKCGITPLSRRSLRAANLSSCHGPASPSLRLHRTVPAVEGGPATVRPAVGPRNQARWLSADGAGGDAHRVFTAAQNCSVTAVVSSVTFQPFVSAFSLANLCSISSIFLVSAYGFQSALDSLAEVFAPQTL